MRGSLVGDHVRHDAAPHEFRHHVGDIAQQADREPALRLLPGLVQQLERFVEAFRHDVAVAGFHPPPDALRIDLHRQAQAVVHRHGQGLRAAHAAEPCRYHQASGEAAAEVLVGAFGEGFVSALHDALRADVNPRPGRHLPVHGQALALEFTEHVPVAPARDQVGIGDQHARRLVVGAEHAHRLAALDQQRLVTFEPPQRLHDALVAIPVARRLAGAAVDDQLVRPLGDGRVQVVHQHAHRRFLVPAQAAQLRAPRGRDPGRRYGWFRGLEFSRVNTHYRACRRQFFRDISQGTYYKGTRRPGPGL
jgi:hypothetical protein